MQFKLTDKQRKSTGRNKDKWFYDDKWISNGVFLISREIVINHYAYCTPDNEHRDNLERCIPTETPNLYLKTTRLYEEDKILKREFVDPSGNKAWFNESLISHFKIDSLMGSDNKNPFSGHDGKIILMPMRTPKEATI